MPSSTVRRLIDATTVNSRPSHVREARTIQLNNLTNDATKKNLENEDSDGNASEVNVQLAPPIRRLPVSLIAFNYTSHGENSSALLMPYFNFSIIGNTPEVLSLTPAVESTSDCIIANAVIPIPLVWWRGGGQFPTPRARIRMTLRYSAAEVCFMTLIHKSSHTCSG